MNDIYMCDTNVLAVPVCSIIQCSDRVFFSARGSVSKRTVSLIWHLQPCSLLPNLQLMGIGERANAAVAEVIVDSGYCNGRKRKYYTAFSDDNRTAIGRHAAENTNVSAL